PAPVPAAAAPARPPARPPSTAAPTPPTIDAALTPAWHALTGIDRAGPDGRSIGTSFREGVETTGVRVVVGELPDAWAAYRVRDNTVTVNRAALGEDPRALAAVLGHEITHARQVAGGHGSKLDCVGMEVNAHAVEAIVWGTFWGGRGPARTRLEQELNAVLGIFAAEGEPGLYKLVVDSQGYQGQCQLWTP
ncbi:MAG: hypothetical protein M3O34_08130, partial [Chloroflexota bacterium]|nr:hypothetical protein [Chloroflexota bacterium]